MSPRLDYLNGDAWNTVPSESWKPECHRATGILVEKMNQWLKTRKVCAKQQLKITSLGSIKRYETGFHPIQLLPNQSDISLIDKRGRCRPRRHGRRKSVGCSGTRQGKQTNREYDQKKPMCESH